MLAEDVVFRIPIFFAAISGAAVGASLWFLLLILIGGASVVVPEWISMQQALLVTSVLSIATGLVGLVWATVRFAGLTMTVNSWGIVVTRRGKKLQSCPWSAMTAWVEGKGWRQSRQLRDQNGRAFPSFGLNSVHVDATLAMRVMEAQAKLLAPFSGATLTEPEGMSWRAPVKLIAVGIVCLPPAIWVGRHLLTLDGLAPTWLRATWLAVLIVGSVGAIGLMAGPIMWLVPLGDYLKRRFPENSSALTEFLAKQPRPLLAVEMEDGIWYRYADPGELRKREGFLPGGIVFAVCGVAVALLGFLAAHGPDLATMLGFAGFGGFIGFIGLLMALPGLATRRALTLSVRRTRDGFDLRRPDGVVISCRVMRMPKFNRAGSEAFGMLAIVLRGDDRRRYRIDARYLVRDEDYSSSRAASAVIGPT